jgi:polar amino acid transport system substrate-binding protein
MPQLIKTITFSLVLMGLINILVSDIWADEITIGVGHTRVPYIIKKTNSGLEIDIIKAAFNQQGCFVKFRYLTNKRVGFFLKQRKLDGILMNKAYDFKKHLDIDAFCSDVHITYHNYAISLSKNKFSILSVDDLKDKSVIGFQDASKYLGPEFAGMTEKNSNYIEKPEQMTQVYRLFLERAQVVVSDNTIFMYYRNKALNEDNFDVTTPVTFHNIFSPSPIHGIFLDKQIRDVLNRGLKKIRETGQYDKILKRYGQ